ncbi:MAG TPA: FliM/FliN family flagellar motor switch protein [Terriglobales bacterium]|nr:FliM/FliN family flagellar motor switch protein [Terriglobales bacterium]
MSTAPVAPPRAVNTFVHLWAEALSNVLAQVASAEYSMQPTLSGQMPQPDAGDVQLTITAAGNVRGEMTVGVPASSVLELARLLTDGNATASELSGDNRSAVEEFFRQVAGHVVTSARPKGLEIQLTTVPGEAPTWSPGASGWICSVPGAPHQLQIEWKLSSALATGIVSSWQEQAASPPAAVREVQDATAESTYVGRAKEERLPAKLDLLMDVELEVALRFGGRNVLLKEILELGPGAVLELDRDIQDEADLLLDGRLIARGEVVAVEGNFGLRVTELLAGTSS